MSKDGKRRDSNRMIHQRIHTRAEMDVLWGESVEAHEKICLDHVPKGIDYEEMQFKFMKCVLVDPSLVYDLPEGNVNDLVMYAHFGLMELRLRKRLKQSN